MALSEDDIQKQIIDWAKHKKVNGKPLSELIHHSPNGGQRHIVTATRFKAMGTLAGFPDLFVFIARGGFNGLFIELKKPKGRVSAIQQQRIDALNEQGYRAVVCYGFDESIKAITDYLETWP